MNKLFRNVFYILLVILGVGILAGIFVLFAYGIGLILMRYLPFNGFEATFLSLLAMGAIVIALTNLLSSINIVSKHADDLDDDWEDDLLEEEEDESEDVPSKKDQKTNFIPGIPLWRQSPRPINIHPVKPEETCPCGSGKRYKDCHGRIPANKK